MNRIEKAKTVVSADKIRERCGLLVDAINGSETTLAHVAAQHGLLEALGASDAPSHVQQSVLVLLGDVVLRIYNEMSQVIEITEAA